jgi:hypothetical protein
MDSRVTTVPVGIPLSDLRPEIQVRTSGGYGTIDLDAARRAALREKLQLTVHGRLEEDWLRNGWQVVPGHDCVNVSFSARTVTWAEFDFNDHDGALALKEIEIWATTGLQSSGNSCSNSRSM